jgi:hypothetical protein
MSLNKFVVLISFLLFVISCSKKKSTSVGKVVTPIDTVSILTGNKWQFTDMWSDYNSNGIIDSLREYFANPILNIFTFYTNGILGDTSFSPAYTTQPGAWYFDSSTKSAFYMAIDPTHFQLFDITGLTDTTMTLLQTQTLPLRTIWYLKKY